MPIWPIWIPGRVCLFNIRADISVQLSVPPRVNSDYIRISVSNSLLRLVGISSFNYQCLHGYPCDNSGTDRSIRDDRFSEGAEICLIGKGMTQSLTKQPSALHCEIRLIRPY